MPVSLFDDIRRAGFHSSIATTFSVDPAFYDANVQVRLRSAGCQNNLLMADEAMLQQALEQLPEAFAQAGRKYLIAPVPVAGHGCFHPKIMIRYGKAKARMILGSANTTSAAWGNNRELISTFQWSENSDSLDDEVHRGLIATAHDWLLRRLPEPRDGDMRYKLELLEAQSSWLVDTPRHDGVAELSDGSLIDLYLSDPDAPRGMAARFVDQLEGEVERLTIISPYWDDDLGALRRLHSNVGAPVTHIFLALSDKLQARQSTFPTNVPNFGISPRFHPVGDSTRHRFLHAKLIVAQTKEHDYVLYGSANCTVAALGSADRPGVNCEAAIFRRLPRGTVDSVLELDYSHEIARKDILSPEKRTEQSSGPETFDPGRIERKSDRLVWSCPNGISPFGSSFLTGGARLPVETPAGGARPFARLSPSISHVSTVVRVELADGRSSKPVIVPDSEMLMATAPHPMADGLRRKLDAVLKGEADLISLARDAHLLFEDGGDRARPGGVSGGGRRTAPSSSMLAGQDFDTPEEFRAALGLIADLHASISAHTDNPTLQMLLRIVLRGIVQLEDSASEGRADMEDVQELLSGEDQDDVGDGEEDCDPTPFPDDGKLTGALMPPRAQVARSVIEKNRAALERALDRFDAHLDTVAVSQRRLDLDFVTRILFMLHMMLHGCVHRYVVEGGEEVVLIPFSAIGTKKQDQGFLMRAAKFVIRVWGRKFRDGLMPRVVVDSEQDAMPLPIVTLVILSRWILAAMLTEARKARGASSFSKALEAEVPRLWLMTGMFGPVDPAQVETTINQMSKLIGTEESHARAIQATVRALSAGSEAIGPSQLLVAAQ